MGEVDPTQDDMSSAEDVQRNVGQASRLPGERFGASLPFLLALLGGAGRDACPTLRRFRSLVRMIWTIRVIP
jgi:hypothetical protein